LVHSSVATDHVYSSDPGHHKNVVIM